MTVESKKAEHIPITVWPFGEAPKALRKASDNGGDEDWIAELPPEYARDCYIPWLEVGPFGCCDVLTYDHPTKPGWTIRVGVHA